MLKNDMWIKEQAEQHAMIVPFVPTKQGLPSYGLEPFGYTFRLDGLKLLIFTGITSELIDPLEPNIADHITLEAQDYFTFPPHSHAVGVSYEKFYIPDNTIALVYGKSTYARHGILVNCTPLEPGWEGYITLG